MITVERLDAGLFGVYLVSLRPPRQGPEAARAARWRSGPGGGVQAGDGIGHHSLNSRSPELEVIGQVDRGDPTFAELTLDGVTAFEGRLQTSDGST